ncbi:MAG TPA: DUF3618 domain-containing protein [Pyrinomonadaceae bacterium]|nr:DUF3618 domain-containing protein [Pyrinomonadaceae bacterium]
MAEETSLDLNNKNTEMTDEVNSEINKADYALGEGETDEETDETEQIRGQIEETRAKMGETIDAIQEKLSIANISEQVTEQVTEQVSNLYQTAKETVYDATIKKAGKIMREVNNELKKSDFIKQVGSKPLPLFFIALGAGLLIFGNKKNGRGSYRYGGNGRSFRRKGGREVGHRGSMLKTATDSISGAASSTYETVGNAANTAYESVGNAANSAYGSVSDFASGTWDKAGEFGGQIQEKYEYYLEENPLAIGAVALAVGAAVGFSIPSTTYENELVGEVRENLMSKVGDSITQTIDKVKNVADEAKNTLTEEVKNQGLA